MSQSFNVFSNMDRNRRSTNFSQKEVQFLLQLVEKKKEIIESKKTDRITSDEKVKAWSEIEEEFNEVFNEFRSIKVLKTKYENLKKIVKKQVPATVSNLGILKIMQDNEQMGKLENEPISDYEYTGYTDDEETNQNSNDASYVETKPQTVHNNDNGGLNPTAEQMAFETLLLGEAQASTELQKTSTTSLTKVQTTEKRKKPLDIWDQVAYKKIKKLNLEMSILEDEWKLRKTKLELELENTRNENKLNEDKLKLEIELLKQKLENKTEQMAFETLLLGEAQASTELQKTSTTSLTKVQTTEKRKKPLDIWDQVAYKKIKKLNLEMSILEDEWKLRKTKLELELENTRNENKLNEDKLKLEIELLKQKLENKSNS